MSSYPLTAIEDIDADEIKALKSVGISTTEKLLEAAKESEGTQAPCRPRPSSTRSGC